MTKRQRLPNRRGSTNLEFDYGPHHFVATASYFADSNQLAEIFLSNGRAGSDLDAAVRESAVTTSLALQYGCPLDVLRRALLRDSHGRPSTPLGAALDIISKEDAL
jgi:hypothetical protein